MSKAHIGPEINDNRSDRSVPDRAGLDCSTAPEQAVLDKIGKGLHDLYDGVPKSTLPIYFGPVLGELYLTPLSRRRVA
jgi:hypothetical protein